MTTGLPYYFSQGTQDPSANIIEIQGLGSFELYVCSETENKYYGLSSIHLDVLEEQIRGSLTASMEKTNGVLQCVKNDDWNIKIYSYTVKLPSEMMQIIFKLVPMLLE